MQKFSRNFSGPKPTIYWSLLLKDWVYTGINYIPSLATATDRMNKVAK